MCTDNNKSVYDDDDIIYSLIMIIMNDAWTEMIKCVDYEYGNFTNRLTHRRSPIEFIMKRGSFTFDPIIQESERLFELTRGECALMLLPVYTKNSTHQGLPLHFVVVS